MEGGGEGGRDVTVPNESEGGRRDFVFALRKKRMDDEQGGRGRRNRGKRKKRRKMKSADE